MKKLCLSILASLALTLGLVSKVQADEYLRIGMEAAYAPFNWTQDDDSNGAVKIDGTNQYANGYDVQIAKKIAKDLGKEPLVVKNQVGRTCSSTYFRQNRYDHCRYEPNG